MAGVVVVVVVLAVMLPREYREQRVRSRRAGGGSGLELGQTYDHDPGRTYSGGWSCGDGGSSSGGDSGSSSSDSGGCSSG